MCDVGGGGGGGEPSRCGGGGTGWGLRSCRHYRCRASPFGTIRCWGPAQPGLYPPFVGPGSGGDRTGPFSASTVCTVAALNLRRSARAGLVPGRERQNSGPVFQSCHISWGAMRPKISRIAGDMSIVVSWGAGIYFIWVVAWRALLCATLTHVQHHVLRFHLLVGLLCGGRCTPPGGSVKP